MFSVMLSTVSDKNSLHYKLISFIRQSKELTRFVQDNVCLSDILDVCMFPIHLTCRQLVIGLYVCAGFHFFIAHTVLS